MCTDETGVLRGVQEPYVCVRLQLGVYVCLCMRLRTYVPYVIVCWCECVICIAKLSVKCSCSGAANSGLCEYRACPHP